MIRIILMSLVVGLLSLGCGNAPVANKANPASVNCVNKGGEVDIRKNAQGGEVGICMFQDGTECEEWAYNNNTCTPGTCLKWNVDTNACGQKK